MRKAAVLLAFLVLLTGFIGPAALAQGPLPPPDGVSLNAPEGQGNTAPESLSGSFVVFDPSVGGDTCFIPGAPQTFCFRAESFTNDWEYVYNVWERFPSDWVVNNVFVLGTPSCTSGSWGSFSWSFETAPYEVNIYHPRYQASTDHCVAYYCFEVTSGTGAPDALESWYWDGDEYGNPPHAPCSNDQYTPPSMAGEPCDEWIHPQAAIPPCVLPPVMLTPYQIELPGCACEPQQHTLAVWNNAGYDTTIDLSYTVVSGAGNCSGPASVFVPDGTNLDITVEFYPMGSPGDTVVCEVYAEDASNPANNDVSQIVKHLVSGYLDPAGWQPENVTGATPQQWAAGAVGTNPAAGGPVGYYVGGLDQTGALNPHLQMYDPATDTWTQLADMPNPRFSPVAGWIGDLLYVAGGYDAGFAATNDLRVYNPATNTWDNTTYPDMPNARGGGAGGVGTCSTGTGECLFHVGGGPDGSFANTTLETWEYNPSTNAWTQLDNKPAGSSPNGFILGAGVGCMGYVYVGGDYRGFHEFYRLDATQPSGSQWAQMANIPPQAGAMTPALVCKEEWGKILLIGGDPDGYWGNYNNTVYVYDIASDTWEGPLPQTLNVAQLGSVALHMYDKVWTFGGTIGSYAITPPPHESLQQISCAPCGAISAQKDAPPIAGHGDIIPYTITIAAPSLEPGMFMTDVLPVGVEYAGNLTFTAGYAWYDPGDNAVYWTYSGRGEKASTPPAPRATGTPGDAREVASGKVEAAAPAAQGPVPTFDYPQAVLWDNGPLVTHPGGCGTTDASRLQTSLSMNTFGFGHQFMYGYRMSDDFEITDPAGWDIDTITFFAYQTGAPMSPSPITGVYLQIWDGPPWAGGSVVWGDLTTNRLLSSTFSGIQRDSETSPCANNRYIFANVAEVGTHLPPGHYWLDWSTDGSTSYSGPWAPPITILGQTTTGDAYQYTTAWAPALDSGTSTQQGMPFIIEGAPGGAEATITFDVLVTAYCGDLIVNEGVAGDGNTVVPFSAATEVVDDPEIVVEPPALWAQVCPDGSETLTLNICNEGCLLTWQLHEMTPTVRSAGLPVAPQVTLPKGVPSSVSAWLAAGRPAFRVQPVPPTLPNMAPETLTFYTSRADFDADFPGLPIEGYENGSMAPGTVDAVPHPLDEFSSNAYFDPGDILPGIQFWATITHTGDEIAVLGEQFMGNPTKTAVANYFSDGYRIVFNPPVQAIGMDLQSFLGGGTCQVDIYDTNGYLTSVTSACDTSGIFWGVASDAEPITELVITDLGGGAEGADTIAFGGSITYPDFPWLSEDPTSGTVNPGACQVVTVSFDATGMAPGDYFANIVINSNDPDEPEVTVPVTMTVLTPAADADFSWAPPSPVAGEVVTFQATASGSEPFTFEWAFGDGSTGSGTPVTHAYAEPGSYDVLLTATNACGFSTATHTIVVQPAGPTYFYIYLPVVFKAYNP